MMNTRIEMPARFTRSFRETESLPTLPVEERTSDMRTIYSAKGLKLILGQKHTDSKPGSRTQTPKPSRPASSKASRPSTSDAKKPMPVGKGVSRPGSKIERGPNNGLTFENSIDMSVSMLSIGSIVGDFQRLMNVRSNDAPTEQANPPEDSMLGSVEDEPSLSQSQQSPLTAYRPLSPLRRPLTPAAWSNPKLFCRYPECKQQFKSAFDLFNHTKKAHTVLRNFHQSVVPVRESGSYRLDGDIDPRARSPPKRANCSGILPDVPKTKLPSPDKNGLVWPVQVLQQQNKFQESFQMADFRAHSAKLRDYNNLVTQEAKEKNWALNKSPGLRLQKYSSPP